MPFKLVIKGARMGARAFCDACGVLVMDAALAHCAYPDTNRLLVERESEAYAFAVLHKGACTDLWEAKHGSVSLMGFQTFLIRLGDDSLTNWAWAFETEGRLREL